jgi:hypothetical protein
VKQLGGLIRNRYFLIVAIATFFVGSFLVLTSEVREAAMGQPELVTDVDAYLLNLFHYFRRPWLNVVAVDFTALGSTTVLTLLTVVFAIFMPMLQRRDLVVHIIVASSGAGLLSVLLKSVFGRERPTLVEKLVQVQGHSYPSGHSLASCRVSDTCSSFLPVA